MAAMTYAIGHVYQNGCCLALCGPFPSLRNSYSWPPSFPHLQNITENWKVPRKSQNIDRNDESVQKETEVEDFSGEDQWSQLAALTLTGLRVGPRARLLSTVQKKLSEETAKRLTLDEDASLAATCSSLISVVLSESLQLWLTQEYPTAVAQLQVPAWQDVIRTTESIENCDSWTLHLDALHYSIQRTVRPESRMAPGQVAEWHSTILDDLALRIAEAASCLYFDYLVSGDVAAFQWLPSLAMDSLASTRALTKFQNKVSLHNWLDTNFRSVEAMYEDRFNLWTLPAGIRHFPSRRRRDLMALSGWRLFYSYFLEASDVLWPILQIGVRVVGNFISYLLVAMIGRSLGLIYKGIRQSFVPAGSPGQDSSRAQKKMT